MTAERLILCGGASAASSSSSKPLRLSLAGAQKNVTLVSDQLRVQFTSDLPSVFCDLVELATYVYCADQAVLRGQKDVETAGANWRRKFHFHVPVRNLDFWRTPAVTETLVSTLEFLSDDDFEFTFSKLIDGPPLNSYLLFAHQDISPQRVDEVVMFSGGLDSFAGAAQETAVNGRHIALVTHKSTPKLDRRRTILAEGICHRAKKARPWFISVGIHKERALGKEFTQRTRSFLYASLGATVAHGFGLSRLRFYENGIITFNLPLCAQVVGSKATRTTHPRVVSGFAKLFSLVSDQSFEVQNPFIWYTKTDVLEAIKRADCSELIRHAGSCTHVRDMSLEHTHCGICSQCIDRRFAVLASGLEGYDPAEAYKVDLLTGDRAEGIAKTMLAAYVDTVTKYSEMSFDEFFSQYGETFSALRHLNQSPNAAAVSLFELHRRHGQQICQVIDKAVASLAKQMRTRRFGEGSLLAMMCGPPIAGENREAERPAIAGDNYFVKARKGFRVRFAGGREHILPLSRGANYLYELLSNARQPIHIVVLVQRTFKSDDRHAFEADDNVVDMQALENYRARAAQIGEELQMAMASEYGGDTSALTRELEQIAEAITAVTGRNGKPRKANSARERLRKAVRAAVRRTIKVISSFDSHLAKHLNECVRCGWQPTYTPTEGVAWVSDSLPTH